jgi:hypothetical protein
VGVARGVGCVGDRSLRFFDGAAHPQPPADSHDGITLDGLRGDALPLAFDLAWWTSRSAAQWPEGSPAYGRYFDRIRSGTQLRLHQAVRGTVTQTAHN